MQQTRYAILSGVQARLQSDSAGKKQIGRKNGSATWLKQILMLACFAFEGIYFICLIFNQ
jgi:hypothetical protein